LEISRKAIVVIHVSDTYKFCVHCDGDQARYWMSNSYYFYKVTSILCQKSFK